MKKRPDGAGALSEVKKLEVNYSCKFDISGRTLVCLCVALDFCEDECRARYRPIFQRLLSLNRLLRFLFSCFHLLRYDACDISW